LSIFYNTYFMYELFSFSVTLVFVRCASEIEN